jgi:hypothetical protein
MNLQGLGSLIYGAMIMAILVFAPDTTPKGVAVLTLCGAIFAYVASLAGYIYEIGGLRVRVFGTINIIAWLVSIAFTALGVLVFIIGA